jgi:shikimate dehydrogenase
VLHRAAYRALGLTSWTYEAIECHEARLPDLLNALSPDWAGLSLTMPLKRAVLPLLDQVEPLASEVGGANTVVFGAGGRAGFNTDVPGMITALAEAGIETVPEALILGAGATACAALGALRGISVGEVTVAVRNPAAAAPLLAVADRLDIKVRLVTFGDKPGRPECRLLISTVPSGAADTYAALVQAGTLTPAAVLDVVYHPWPTRLAGASRQAGAVVVGGFELLLHQAASQVVLMTGRDAPTAAMRADGLDELSRRSGTT